MDFHERKRLRKEHFEQFVKGWKERPCTACNGIDYYVSPKCDACNGTGKEKYKPISKKHKQEAGSHEVIILTEEFVVNRTICRLKDVD